MALPPRYTNPGIKLNQEAPVEPQGLLSRLGSGLKNMTKDPNFYDKLAVGLGGMTTNPNTGLIKMSQDRIAQRAKLGREKNKINQTIQTIQQMNTPQSKRALQLLQAGGSVTDALKMVFEKPKEQGQVLDADALRQMFPNMNIEDGLYNLKPDGTMSKVGGGGVTVNTGDAALSPFQKKAQENLVTSYSSERSSGLAARSTLSNVNLLDQLLSSASTGGFDAALKTTAKKVFGIDIGDDRLTAANAILGKLIPSQRVAGSGTMSDADLSLYKSSLPSIMNKPGGNEIIIRTMRGMAEYQIQMGDIASRALYGEITPRQADELMSKLADPLKDVMVFISSNQILPPTVASINRGGSE